MVALAGPRVSYIAIFSRLQRTCSSIFLHQAYAQASLTLAFFVLCGTLSIFASFAMKDPFIDGETKISYTGFRWWMLQRNMWPNLSDGNTTAKVFGVLFPACNGILAGK